MDLPKKINPDSIKEAVVEIKYQSTLPFEVLVGIFFNSFDESYTYINRPPQPPTLFQGGLDSPGQELRIRMSNQSVFYNDKISIQLFPNSFVFTCLEEYPGWDDYFSEINKALNQLNESRKITGWIRVGVRYISEYPNTELSECIKFTYSFGIPEVNSSTSAFRSEFFFNEKKVILNLSNKVTIIKQNTKTNQYEEVQTSIIDVDVISDKKEIHTFEQLLNEIKENHLIEKEVYFRLLKDEFLKSLKPEY